MLKKVLISLALVGLLAVPVMAEEWEYVPVPDEESGQVAADNVILTKKEIRAAYAGTLAQQKAKIVALNEQIQILRDAKAVERAIFLEMKAALKAAILAGTVVPDVDIGEDPE
uniref:Uncharacterized protein n=1 Tax=viral metagenome TaxID=1070528 RepID=A0A6M3KI88_9ZZZZ